MKKLLASGIVLGSLFVASTAVSAEETSPEIVSADSELYETVRVMEDTEYSLTESPEEKIILQDDYAEKRLLEAIEQLENGDEESAEELLNEYDEQVQHIEESLENAVDDNEDISNLETIVEENAKYLKENLLALLEREDLPDTAKAGITKALENQARAMKNFAKALEKAELAMMNGNSNNGSKDKDEVEENLDDTNEAAEKADEEAEKAAEKAQEEAEKAEEKAREEAERAEEKAREEAERAEEKAREEAKRAEEKAKEEAKRAEEKVREEAKRTEEKAREEAERAREKAQNEENEDSNTDEQ
jgi:Domain of unknown function (DUF5667)